MKMEKFAKLFESERLGQILVVLEDGDESPSIKISFKPEGLGVCATSFVYEDTDDGWDKAQSKFNEEIDQEFCEKIIQSLIDNLNLSGLGANENED